jgi:hypothetical protein
MANSTGRRGGSGTRPLIGSPGGKSLPAVSDDAGGCGAAITGALGAGLFAASPLVGPTAGGVLAFGLGQTILLGAAAGEGGVGLLAATCVALADIGDIVGAVGAGAAGVWTGVVGVGCAAAIFAGGAGTAVIGGAGD